MDGTISGEYTGDMPGRKQPHPFDPHRAAVLDDPEREKWLPAARIVELLDVHEGMRVLDYGAGTGRTALAIARAHPDAAVVAFDIQQRMLDILDARIRESTLQNIRAAGPEPSDVDENSFDRVLGVHILHEIDDEHLEHIRHALKPGGMLLMIDWDRDAKRNFGPPPDHVHSSGEALERLRRSGFTPERLSAPEFPYSLVLRAIR